MADITYRGALIKDDNSTPLAWRSVNITAAAPTTTTVKSTGGVLGKIIFNKPVATGTTTIYNAPTATGNPVATITTPASPQPSQLEYNIDMSGGITIVTATAAQDITVTYV